MVDYTLDNQPGATFRAELNLIIAALVENAYSATAPTTTFPGQWWVDASGANPVVKQRNAADTGWITLGTMNPAGFELAGSTAFSRSLLDDADAATARATLGVGLGSMEFIESQDASASASLDFTGFNAARYDAYKFVLSNVTPTADATFSIRTSTDGGSTYDSGAGAYDLIYHDFSAQGSTEGDTSSNAGLLNLTQSVGAAAGEDGMSGTLMLYGPHLAKRTRWTFEGVYQEAAAGGVAKAVSHGYRDSAADVDAIQFAATSTTLASGTITMYGLRNSV